MIGFHCPGSVAVLSRSFARHPILRQELLAKFPTAVFNDSGRTLAGDELVEFLTGHDAAIVALERFDAALFDRLPGLSIISKYGVGLDNVDLVAAQAHGVRVGWRGGVNRQAVAELTLAMLLWLLRGIGTAQDTLRSGEWKQVVGRELGSTTLGIIGFGHCGTRVAELAQPFGTRLLANDIRDVSVAAQERGAEVADLDRILDECDAITIHVPLTEATRGFIDENRIRAMRKGAVLVCAARGGIIDEVALKGALLSGHLAGAGLDVFAVEPPTDSELISCPNLVVTPHIGGSSSEAILAMGRSAIEGLDRAVHAREHIPSWAKPE